MSKAYIVTKVTHSDANDAPKVVAVELSYSEAVKAKIADMRDTRSRYSDDNVFTYDEDEGCIVFREGEENCIVWGVEEKETSKMNKDDMHYTGCFVICNFGPEGNTNTAPVYLGDPTRGITPNHFTANICKAQTFAYKTVAEAGMKRENEFLEAEKHPLAGHLFIAEIYVHPIVEPKED